MSQSELEYLRHIQDEAAYLTGVGRDTEKSRFVKDETLKRASARSIEIIGEATKQLSDDLRERHSEVPWQQMARMRDRLIHSYFSVDYDIVWDVIENEAPPLQDKIARVIEAEAA